MIYQTHTFGLLAVYVLAVDYDTFPPLDRQILQGFVALHQEWPEQALELEKLVRKYDFIRPRLLRHDQAWVPGSAV